MSKPFRFKQFEILQDLCAMKVGTDSVILGSLLQPGLSDRILDIGTGTGILALMMAQKGEGDIDAVEIDPDACVQAEINFKNSPWSNRIRLFSSSFQEYYLKSDIKYELIVSNPPFFELNKSKSSLMSKSRSMARSYQSLGFEELISGVKRLLSPGGKFGLVLPLTESVEFLKLAENDGLKLCFVCNVKSLPDTEIIRRVMVFSDLFSEFSENHLVIYENRGLHSLEYIELTKDFYPGTGKYFQRI